MNVSSTFAKKSVFTIVSLYFILSVIYLWQKLLYDGANYVYAIFQADSFYFPHGRFSTFISQFPTVFLQQITRPRGQIVY